METFTLINLISNYYYFLMILSYLFAAFFWYYALKYFDLSTAYFTQSISYIFLLFSSWYFFDEKITIPNMIGVVFIVIGVNVILKEKQND